MDKEKTIIFAEPTDALYSDLNHYIDERGYNTIRAANLKETLLTLQDKKVDVLVLDAALLEEDCGFISVIKGMVKGLPVIICSEINTPELESEIRKQRIFYYHIKAFGIEDLEMALSNAVNGIPH
jgi:DNA-binding NtrC family response regulator